MNIEKTAIWITAEVVYQISEGGTIRQFNKKMSLR